ncbi:hypothetical protein [Variovorax sp. GT1P44]|uniref:hypothetical protein n=1 Tax=Variovorax sp. GT1P44 TaxID=3443742 RepID=UPI003F48FA9A
MRAAIKASGLRLEPVGTAGAVRVVGPGVHIVAASLRHLNPLDLTPYRPIEDEHPPH